MREFARACGICGICGIYRDPQRSTEIYSELSSLYPYGLRRRYSWICGHLVVFSDSMDLCQESGQSRNRHSSQLLSKTNWRK
ncbi:hypothetical protein, partial [Paenibacillus odorifer]|uniref:hypothetical protein n=1 Tax=Paenibacillus odorifer TaxID=189426 RepID=UPI001C4D5F2E